VAEQIQAVGEMVHRPGPRLFKAYFRDGLTGLLMAGGLRASAETAVPTENVTVTSHAVRSMNSPRPSPRRQWSRER
jgi:hypothetical protein